MPELPPCFMIKSGRVQFGEPATAGASVGVCAGKLLEATSWLTCAHARLTCAHARSPAPPHLTEAQNDLHLTEASRVVTSRRRARTKNRSQSRPAAALPPSHHVGIHRSFPLSTSRSWAACRSCRWPSRSSCGPSRAAARAYAVPCASQSPPVPPGARQSCGTAAAAPSQRSCARA